MIKRRKALIVLTFFLVAAVAAFFLKDHRMGVGKPESEGAAAPGEILMSAEQMASVGIKTVPLTAVTSGAGAGFPAKAVIPNNQLRVVGAPVDGIIETVQVAVNQPVSEGQTLLEIKSPSLIDEQRQFLHAVSEAQVARSAMARDKELLSEGIIAKSRYLTTQSTAAQAEADLQEKRQALQLFGMQTEEIKTLEESHTLSNTVKVAAPITGFVLEQMAIAGQRIEAASPLYKIGALSPLWLEIHMPADQAARVAEGNTVTVEKAGSRGRVISVGKSLEPSNQTIMVRAEITENTDKIRAEEMVVAAIDVAGSGAKQWQLPLGAVVRQEGKPYIFIKTQKGFRAQTVAVDSESATAVVISAPLSEKDQVAIDGVIALKGAWLGMGGGE